LIVSVLFFFILNTPIRRSQSKYVTEKWPLLVVWHDFPGKAGFLVGEKSRDKLARPGVIEFKNYHNFLSKKTLPQASDFVLGIHFEN
jgi:hypothetical protein